MAPKVVAPTIHSFCRVDMMKSACMGCSAPDITNIDHQTLVAVQLTILTVPPVS